MTSPPPTRPDHTASPPTSDASTKRSGRLIKWLLWLGAGLGILLLGAGLLLTYWFPSELVRQELEVRLSSMLNGTVRIQSLSFNLLTGLNIRHAQFIPEGHAPLKVDHLHLNYSLWGLLQGSFRINEVSLEGADLVLNLPELSRPSEEPPVSEETIIPPEPPQDRPLLPILPVSIDLDTLKVRDSHLHVIVSPDLLVRLKGINLLSSGGISTDAARLQGTLDIQSIALSVQDAHLQFPLTMIFDTSIALASEQISLTRLTIQSEPILHTTLAGTVNHALSQNDLEVTLDQTQFDLAQLLRLGQDFVPPEFQNVMVKGLLSPRVTLKGSAPDGLFSGTIQGELKGKRLEASVPSFDLSVAPTDLELLVDDIRVKQNQPILGQTKLTLSASRWQYQAHQVNNLRFGLSGEYLDAGPVSGTLNLSGETLLPEEWLGTPVNIPFAVSMAARGNHKTHGLMIQDLTLQLEEFGQINGVAAWEPQPADQGTKASLDIRWLPQLKTWLPLLPKDMLPGLTLQKGSGSEHIQVQATALLNDDFLPRFGSLTTAVQLSSLRARLTDPAAQGTMDDLSFLLSAAYEQARGTISGTAGITTNLSRVSLPDQLALHKGTVTLKSTFHGKVSPSFEPVALRSRDQVQIVLNDLHVTHPSVSARLPMIKVLSKTREDVMHKDVILENLQVTSPGILEMTLQGRVIEPAQKFEVDFRIPVLLPEPLLAHLSGPIMEDLKTINPKGLISASLRTAGTVPSADDLENLALPLRFNGTVSMKDAGGLVAGYGLKQANGSLSLNYSPSATPPLQLTTDLHVQDILLPDGMPFKGLANTGLQITLTSPSVNELEVTQIRLTGNGLNVDVRGNIVGLRSFLQGTSPLGTSLANSFAELHTRAEVDVGVLQKMARPMGLQGSGQTAVQIHLRKKELGSLDTSMDLSLNDLTVKHDQAHLQGATGTIRVRKSLSWQNGPDKTRRERRFQPSDVITQLKRLSGTEKTLTIKRLQAGTLAMENVSIQLHFDQHALKLQNMAMNLMGGGLGGHFIVSAEQPPRASAWLEAAHLDINQLLDPADRIKGDSEIAATIGLSALLNEKTGALDFSRSDLQLHITHIGKEALDRLLVFLDPQGSNPTLANARSQLKLANPSNVTIEIARGLLSLTIRFQSRLVPTFMMERVPLAKMTNVERMTAAIPNWEDVAGLLHMLGAEAYAISPEGEVTFH